MRGGMQTHTHRGILHEEELATPFKEGTLRGQGCLREGVAKGRGALFREKAGC